MDIRTVGIVGAGTMGSGIGTNLAQAGFAVVLVDARPGAAAGTVGQAKGFYARAVEKGRMTADAGYAAADRLGGVWREAQHPGALWYRPGRQPKSGMGRCRAGRI